MSEVFLMDEDQFVEDVRNSLRLFEDMSADNMASLFRMASISGYDDEASDFLPYEGNTREYHLIGLPSSSSSK